MRPALAILISLFFLSNAAAASIDDDVERYVQIFKGDKSQHIAAAQSLGWAGLSDPRLFDVIEQRLLQDYPVDANERGELQRISWYIRALGFSGQDKYTQTLNKFLADPAYATNTRHTLQDVPAYLKWNPVISNRTSFNPQISDDANRSINMLRSDDFLLKRLGAKKVYNDHQDNDVLLDVLADQIRLNYKNPDRASQDAVAWMLKGLGISKKEKYKPLIVEVLNNSSSNAIYAYALAAYRCYADESCTRVSKW